MRHYYDHHELVYRSLLRWSDLPIQADQTWPRGGPKGQTDRQHRCDPSPSWYHMCCSVDRALLILLPVEGTRLSGPSRTHYGPTDTTAIIAAKTLCLVAVRTRWKDRRWKRERKFISGVAGPKDCTRAASTLGRSGIGDGTNGAEVGPKTNLNVGYNF